MKTFPSGPSIKSIVNYNDPKSGIVFTVSRRSGGIGRPDYLITGTNGFSATRLTQDKAIETARRELARVAQDA